MGNDGFPEPTEDDFTSHSDADNIAADEHWSEMEGGEIPSGAAWLDGNSPLIVGCSGLLDILRKTGGPTRHECARVTVEQYRGNMLVFTQGSIWLYNDATGCYSVIPECEIKRAIARYDGSVHGRKRGRINMAEGAVESGLALVKTLLEIPDFFEHAAHGIATPSCTWIVHRRRLIKTEHSPDHRLRHCFPVDAIEYENGPDADVFTPITDPAWRELAPVYIRFLESCQPFDRCAEALEFIRSLTAVSMVGMAAQYQQGAFLAGTRGGANGKSTLMQILRELLFPPGSCVASDPENWNADYQRAPLAGAWANLIDEMGDWSPKILKLVKRAVNGNRMEARRIGGDVFEFTPRAGWIIGMNAIDIPRGVDGAFWRRWAILDFDETIPRDKRIPEHEILAGVAAELPTILMMTLQALSRVLRDGKLPTVEQSEVYRKALQLESDQLRQWVDACLRVEGDGRTWYPMDTLYDRYLEWREAKRSRRKQPEVSKIDFCRRIAKYCKGVAEKNKSELSELYTPNGGGRQPARVMCDLRLE